MKTIKAEFFSKADAYAAIGAIRNLCVHIEIHNNGNYGISNEHYSHLELNRDFSQTGIPGSMYSNKGFPQFNGMAWGSFGMNDTPWLGYDRYDSSLFTAAEEGVVLDIEADDQNLAKLKDKLYSLGAAADFPAQT